MHDVFCVAKASFKFFLLTLLITLTACGGSGNNGESVDGTGSVFLFLTDGPTDELSAIYLDITEATLIGGSGQQNLFSGNTTINLLDLENFNQPIAFGEVLAGDYTKIRLQISRIELVDKNTGRSSFPPLPANGKIDLLDQGRFTVLPGRTLVVEIDVDANKSIHIVGTGNGTYQFRPVVKVDIMDTGLPDKLARLEGNVAEIINADTGIFLLCDVAYADICLEVHLAPGGGVFDADGIPVDISELEAGNSVVVIGRYRQDGGQSDFDFDAIVVEIGGNSSQIRGLVASAPDTNGLFALLGDDDVIYSIQLQNGTKIFDQIGEINPSGIIVGLKSEVEGVVVAPEPDDSATMVRAAFVIVDDSNEEEMLSGSIAAPIDPPTQTFNLTTAMGDRCVGLHANSNIILISQNQDGTTVEVGDFSDLAVGQIADAYGQPVQISCFQADDLVIDLGTGS